MFTLKQAANWIRGLKSFIPAPGNIVFSLVLILCYAWVQSSGVLANNVVLQTGNVSRPFPYQGRLADSAGNSLTNTYPMIFRLYDVAIGGSPLWQEQWTGENSVKVSDGLFNVMLGNITPIPSSVINSPSQLYLGIQVGTDSEMQPRIQLGSVPFSQKASSIEDNTIDSDKIINGSIKAEDLAAGTIPSQMPVGTVIAWWRADANTPLPSGDWKIADGSIINDAASPLNGKTLPDLRNRFVMGVDSSTVGQLGGTNTLNLSHSHTVASHTHYIPDHVHSISHDHNTVDKYAVAGGSLSVHTDILAPTVPNSGSWGGESGAASPGTDTQLIVPVDNRPAYVGLIYIIKVK
jgi:hypothetical protein